MSSIIKIFIFLLILTTATSGAFEPDSKLLDSIKGKFVIKEKSINESIHYVNSFLDVKKIKLNFNNPIGLDINMSKTKVSLEINGSLDDVVLNLRQILKDFTKIEFKLKESKDKILIEPDLYYTLIIHSDAISGISYHSLEDNKLGLMKILALNDSIKDNDNSYQFEKGQFILIKRKKHIDELIKKSHKITKDGLTGLMKFFKLYKVLYLEKLNCYVICSGPDGREFLNRLNLNK